MAKLEGSVSLASHAYTLLRQDVIDGILAPGSKLVIAELQERYSLGATPLREALNQLSSEYYVLKHDHRGFSVPSLEPKLFLEIQNARITIETAMLRETIALRDPIWEDQMVVAYHHLTKSKFGIDNSLHTESWAIAHAEFHRLLISGSQNSLLTDMASRLFQQSARYRSPRRKIGIGNGRNRDGILEEHKNIMDAAISGDSNLATQRLVEHYRMSVEAVLGVPVTLSENLFRFQLSDSEC